MSHICIGFAYGVRDEPQVRKALYKIAVEHGCWIGFTMDQEEPFLDGSMKEAFFLNFADNSQFPNCEMLLLPDGWYSNGRNNPVPFWKRMKVLSAATTCLLEKCSGVDLFIGDSGLELSDFTAVSVTPEEIPGVMREKYCGATDCDPLRLRVQAERNEK